MTALDDIRSKAVPLYQLLTVGRMDQSGDWCEGAQLTRDQALALVAFVLTPWEGTLSDMDRAAISWIRQNMPEDGSAYPQSFKAEGTPSQGA